ncbi:MAG TPA: POTRA domain-containing protein [Hanamia sp.]|nr:POTRA domain-containing protein [Hanamia sp.]
MPKIYKILLLIAIAVFTTTIASAQIVRDSVSSESLKTDSIPTSVNIALENVLNSQSPKRYTLSNITVTGTSFDPNLIISISGLAKGDKITLPGSDAFSNAITNLWKQNLVSNVEIYLTQLVGDDLSIEIHITDRPVLSSFKFKGIGKSEADDITKKLDIHKGKLTRVTQGFKVLATSIIDKYFVDKGFRNVTVQINEVKDTKAENAVNLIFIIDKNGKVRINNIYFAGNKELSDFKLRKQMKGTHEESRLTLLPLPDYNVYDSAKSNHLSFNEYLHENGYLVPSKTLELVDPYFRFKLLSSAKFNEKKYIEDKNKILDYYNSLGYRDAAIVDDTTYNDAKGNLDVAIKVSEGHRYYFGNIIWKGNTKYPDSILNLILGIKKGDIYNAEILNKRLGVTPSATGGDISSLYEDDGYLFFRVTPIETSVYNDTIDHEIDIVEGPQATIGNVSIAGNTKTKDYVIRRELRTIPGEKFSREKIIRTQRELSQLGYFDPEKINPGIDPHQESGTVDITWNLVEKSSDQLELSAGFGGGIGLTGTLGVTFNNFSIYNILKKKAWDPLPVGDGQRLSLRGQSNGKSFRSYNFSFTEPWLGGKKRDPFTISYYNTKYANAYDPYTGYYNKNYADTSYIKTIGFSVSLGKQLKWPDDFFSLVYQLNYIKYDLKKYNIFPGLSSGTSNNINLKITFARTSAGPNPIFPTRGSNFIFSTELTPPYSILRGEAPLAANEQYKWIEYHKERFTAQWYVPLSKATGEDKDKQFVLYAAAKYGFIGKYSASAPASPFGRFQLGDAGLSNNYGLLGYDIISQRGYPIYDNSNPKINPDISQVTNFFTIFNKYTLEVRYPFSTSASSTIYGLAFFEAANGWYSFQNYNPFQLRRSVGLGARFFLPMFGLLGFDYGIGIDRITPGGGLKGAGKFTFMLGQEPE